MEYKGNKIIKRNDGRYCYRFTVNGTRHTVYGKTQKECLQKAKKETAKYKPSVREPTKLFEYIDFWINTYKKSTQNETTLRKTIQTIDNHIKTNLLNKAIKDFTTSEINKFLANFPNIRKKEDVTIIIKGIFKSAFENDNLIKTDISKNFIKYKHKRSEGKSLTKLERQKIIDSAGKVKNGDIIIFYLFSGARQKELLTLKFQDISNDTIHIPGTKSTGSNRFIPNFKPLKQIIAKKTNYKPTDYVFPFTSIRQLTYVKEEVEKQSGIKFHIKDLRTTFGTMCAEQGISESVIAKWMGHTTTKTTRKYYIKVLSDFEKEQANKFDTNFDTNFNTNNDKDKK